MSKADTWMPLYIGKYLGATSHLTTEQHGAYFLLLMAAWKRGGWLPDDDEQLASTCKLTLETWRRHRRVLIEFFEVHDGRWVQERVTAERAKATHISAVRSENGKLGGRPKTKQIESSEKALGLQKPKQTETPPQPHTSEEVEKDADASSVGSGKPTPTKAWLRDEDFQSAWKASTDTMRTRSGQKQAHAAWKASPAAGAEKLAALKAYLARDPDVKRTGGPGLHLWLRDKLDTWLSVSAETPKSQSAVVWMGPPDVREAVIGGFSGDVARASSFLNPCRWDADRRAIVSENGFSLKIIGEAAGKRLSRIGVRLIHEEGRAA